MDLGHQRAGCIQNGQPTLGGLFFDAFGDPVGTEDGNRMRRNFRQILDKDRAFALQALDHVFVMDDLVAHIDRGAVFLQRALDDLDGTHDSGAKTTRLREKHFHGATVKQAAPRSLSVSVR
jgi:hypothetical protein